MNRDRSRVVTLLGWLALVLGGAVPGAYAQAGLEGAENALRTGRYHEAVTLYQRLARRDPGSADAALGQVRALAEVGRYAEAEKEARRYLDENAGSPQLWNALGEVLRARGRREAAEAAFREALDRDAGEALVARLNLAILRYERGEQDGALREFDRFIDVYNRSRGLSVEEMGAVATAVRYLGVEDPQLYKDALRAYDEAIAADPGALDSRVKLGELFLEKYNSADAAAAFRDVLEVNPSHPRALLGMARRARFDGEPQAMQTVERVLKVNPNLVAARVFRAELLLELEDYEEAVGEAERALDVDPASLEALAVLATARFLRGDLKRYEEARRRALRLNPRYAGLFTKLSELSARNRLYQRAVEFAQQAVELDPRAWRGYALLGINQLRVGEIEAGRRNLEVAFAGDPYDVWTKNTLDLLDTFADYELTRTGRFVIAVDGGESELLSLYLSDLAEEAYERLARRYGFAAATPIRVEVFRSHADFSVRTVGLVGLGALGVSFGPVIAMDSPSAREAGRFNWGSTFWHELAHTFHLGLSQHRVPRWFSEGLAVYEERRARPGWGDDVTPSFLSAHLGGKLLPLGRLNAGFARPAYPEQLGHSYYQASLVCELIEREAGPRAFVDMLVGYRDGLSTDQVFRRVLGTSVDEFSDHFFEYLERRFATALSALRAAEPTGHGERLSRAAVEQRAHEHPRSYYAQLALGRALLEEGELEGARLHLERAKALFPEYAGPGSPYPLLARLHKEQGALAKAAQELEALTAINERDHGANLELADLKEALGDAAGAAAALGRAIFIAPFDLSTHLRLAGLSARTGEHAAAIRERRAVLALDPVDRPEALYQLARAYYEAGDVSSARRAVLRALEEAPSFEKAQELLLELRARREGGAK